MFSFKMGYQFEFIVVCMVLVCAVPGEKWRFIIANVYYVFVLSLHLELV